MPKQKPSRSIIDPKTCGFMKAAVYQLNAEGAKQIFKSLSTVESSTRLKAEFRIFCELFEMCDTSNVDYVWYRRNYEKIKNVLMRLGKGSKEKKKEILSLFGRDAWAKLDDRKKVKHTLFLCNECLKNHAEGFRLYPVNNMNLRGKEAKSKIFKEKEDVVKKAVDEKVKELDEEFMKKYKWKFAEAAGIESGSDLEKKERKLLIQAKKDIENTWKKISVMRFERVSCEFLNFSFKFVALNIFALFILRSH
eukprot:TCONS_00040979-protein